MKIENKEAAKAAADWWANQLSGTKFDNGEPMHGILAQMVSDGLPKLSDDQISRFRKELLKAICEAECHHDLFISVDYHPCAILRIAGEAAGIDVGDRLPWKTGMKVSDKNVTIACGYGAPFECIYGEEEI